MIRSAPLARKTPLKRTWMKSRPRKRKATKAEKAFMDMVAGQPCVFMKVGDAGDCEGRTQVHHHGRKGLSQRVSHYRTVPLCEKHHMGEWHDTGTVLGFSRDVVDLLLCRESVRLLVMWAERCDAF